MAWAASAAWAGADRRRESKKGNVVVTLIPGEQELGPRGRVRSDGFALRKRTSHGGFDDNATLARFGEFGTSRSGNGES